MVSSCSSWNSFFFSFLQGTKGNVVTDETQPGNIQDCQNDYKNDNKLFMLIDQDIFLLLIRLDLFLKETKQSKHKK